MQEISVLASVATDNGNELGLECTVCVNAWVRECVCVCVRARACVRAICSILKLRAQRGRLEREAYQTQGIWCG